MSEAAAMSDRDLLIEIANDSKYTKKSLSKLFDKTDDLSSTMSEVLTTQKSHGSTLETMSDAVFTGDNALSPRVRVLEDKRPGKPSKPPPAAIAPTESASSSAKMFGGIIVALIAVISTLVASR